MAGSPKKRARKKALRLAEAGEQSSNATPPARLGPADVNAMGEPGGSPDILPLVGEILPPEPDVDVTRTALKRAMRRAAEKHAERAMEVLALAMEHGDMRIAVPAAREILDRSIGKPTGDLEISDKGVQVAIIRFGQET